MIYKGPIIDLTKDTPVRASRASGAARGHRGNKTQGREAEVVFIESVVRIRVEGRPLPQKERDINTNANANTMYVDPSQHAKYVFATKAREALANGTWPKVDKTRPVKVRSRFVFKKPTNQNRSIASTKVLTNTLEQFVLGALKGHLFEDKGQIIDSHSTKEFGDRDFTEVVVTYL